jgi:hypothetical protein
MWMHAGFNIKHHKPLGNGKEGVVDNQGQDLLLETQLIIDLNQGTGG